MKPAKIEGGARCPKCRHPMQRYQHGAEWRPMPGRSWYRFWDRCANCGRFQHYGAAKVEAASTVER